MNKFETVEVPFQQVGDRQCLTDEQIANAPYRTDFIKSFPRCFARDFIMNVWVYYPGGNAPRSLTSAERSAPLNTTQGSDK